MATDVSRVQYRTGQFSQRLTHWSSVWGLSINETAKRLALLCDAGLGTEHHDSIAVLAESLPEGFAEAVRIYSWSKRNERES